MPPEGKPCPHNLLWIDVNTWQCKCGFVLHQHEFNRVVATALQAMLLESPVILERLKDIDQATAEILKLQKSGGNHWTHRWTYNLGGGQHECKNCHARVGTEKAHAPCPGPKEERGDGDS